MNNNSFANDQIGPKLWAKVSDYIDRSTQGGGPAVRQIPAQDLADELQLSNWIKNGGLNEQNLSQFIDPYLHHTQHMHHPHYIGHQVAVPHIGSALSDMMHGMINNPMAVYEMGPSASICERVVVNWMLSKLGWYQGDLNDVRGQTEANPDNGAGVLTHGGSLANLTGLLAARAKFAPNAWADGVPNNLAVIAPQASHYSFSRAVSIAGLGQKAFYGAAVNDLEIMQAEQVEKVYNRAQDEGRDVFMVSANACTTATGLYDPLDEIADFCTAHNIWFHVDGAHGATALLSDKHKGLLRGIERADSMIWDAHKMMRTSALCAAVLFKDQSSLAGTFQQKGSYIFYDNDKPGFDVGPHAVECTKSALGTKLFMVLAMEGEAGMGDFIDKQYDDTRQFHDYINAQPDFSCPYIPQSNILCFHYDPIEDDELQLEIRKRMVEQGDFYITSAEVGGRRYLRLSVMNPLTTLDTIKDLLDAIRECAKII